MSERLDPEEVRDIMNAVWQRLDAAIIERGGVIDKHIGDAVMALFGLPSARVDDPQRSVAYRAVAQMITATALRRPAVMLFEDLHASDDASLDLSAWLLASCQDIPVLCDHAYRPTLYERRPTWGAGIRRHTRLASLSIPPTLTGVLQTRLDALDAGERRTLQRAAVVGRRFWDAAIRSMVEGEGGDAAGELARLERLASRSSFFRRLRAAQPLSPGSLASSSTPHRTARGRGRGGRACRGRCSGAPYPPPRTRP
jgi:hypothetical protein